MVRRSDRDGIYVTVVEDAPEIRFRLRISAVLLLQERQGALEMPFVDVHDMGDANACNAGQMFVVILSPSPGRPRRVALVVASNADDRDVDGVVRAGVCAGAFR